MLRRPHFLTIVVLTLLVLFSLSACESPSGSDTVPQTESSSGSEITEVVTAPTTSSFSIPGTLVAENFDIAIISATLSDSVTLNAGINVDFPADEGMQFLILCIDATNTSEEVQNLGSFIAYVDNTVVLPYNVLGKLGDRMLFVGAVDPGKTMGTYVLYQLPASWETFEFAYEDSWTGSRSEFALICRSDIS